MSEENVILVKLHTKLDIILDKLRSINYMSQIGVLCSASNALWEVRELQKKEFCFKHNGFSESIDALEYAIEVLGRAPRCGAAEQALRRISKEPQKLKYMVEAFLNGEDAPDGYGSRENVTAMLEEVLKETLAKRAALEYHEWVGIKAFQFKMDQLATQILDAEDDEL